MPTFFYSNKKRVDKFIVDLPNLKSSRFLTIFKVIWILSLLIDIFKTILHPVYLSQRICTHVPVYTNVYNEHFFSFPRKK